MGTKNEKKLVAVVTGGNRGIGLETCRQLARKGMHVVLTARDATKGKAAAAALAKEGLVAPGGAPYSVEFAPLDVTSDASAESLARMLKEKHGRVDVLVNNAGILLDEPDSVTDVDLALVLRTFETNALGALRVAKKLVPLMKGAPARIVNVSSGMGQLSEMNSGHFGYRLSKTALNAVTRILSDELGDQGFLVNSVCPGWVRTDMGGEGAEREIPEGADTIVWLASERGIKHNGMFFRDRERMEW